MLYKLMELASDPLGSGLTFLQQGVLVVQAEDLQLLRQLLGGHGHGDPGEVGACRRAPTSLSSSLPQQKLILSLYGKVTGTRHETT